MKILLCFERASGLRINFQKSSIIGVGVKDQEVQNVAARFKCQMEKLPFTYLGITIGSNMKKSKDWKLVIEKFNSRLSEWKARAISFGGRLTLVKSVLNSLPLYFFSQSIVLRRASLTN
ncbi:uncharacterized protein [Rutidosis leptorrhynchoides]|uniref:uncharacterized protein n=1 Tax=Rutidosis leptorrhynchoides TaxID=125765 RepID=UPI003A996494